ncbi:MAG: uridine kinase [Actinomycetota bacterium]|nr:uridine kinase [Actinomycetota bacterium]
MIAALADVVLAAPPRLGLVRLIGIDGPSGAGKTDLATALIAELRSRAVTTALVSTDDFATWADPVAWWPRLVDGVLAPAAAGRHGRYRRMDWSDGPPRLGESVTVDIADVMIIEGVSAGRRAVSRSLSVLVWVEMPDSSARLERAVTRDGEANRAELARWQTFENGWFAVDGARDRASVRVATEP